MHPPLSPSGGTRTQIHISTVAPYTLYIYQEMSVVCPTGCVYHAALQSCP